MISEQLRVTLLSLKQISDRLKLLDTNSVTKSEALAYKNEIIEALGGVDFTEIIEALDSIDGKVDEQFVHSLTHTKNNYMAADSQINRIVIRYSTNDFRNYDLVGVEVVDNITYYKWATVNTMPIGYVYTDRWKGLVVSGGNAVYVKEGDTMVRLKDQYGNNNNTWQAQSFKNATTGDINEVREIVVESKPIPFASATDNILTLYMVTVKQMERLNVYTNVGLVKFNVTFDEDNYYLAYSDDSPVTIAGTEIENDAKSLYDNNYIETIELTFPDEWTISQVFFDDTDNILEQGDAWRLADLQRKTEGVAQFFGLPQALPEYQSMTDEEIKSINTDIWLGLYGYEVVKNTLHYKNFIDEVVTIDTYFNSGKTYADYGYTSLWSAHDVTVDVNSNPIADAEIYTYNPPVE